MRVTKLVKFLPRFGWQPLVLTVKRIAYYHYDENLLGDWKGVSIYRAGSLDPARLRYLLMPGRPVSQSGTGKAAWLSNVLCFPDAKAGWFASARRLGERVIRQEKPDAIFATAPPFTTLMIGAALKRFSGLPLVADFRDPWPMGFVPPPRFLIGRTERLRRRILGESDAVLAVNHGTAAFLDGKAEVLENGFDPDEFAVGARKLDGFNIVHVGNVWENEQELVSVLDATREMNAVRVRLVGKTSARLKERLVSYSHFEDLGLLPHGETLAVMKGADLLLYLSKPSQSVGIKLYEYLGAGRPILSVGCEDSEAAQLVVQHHAGKSVGSEPGVIRRAVELAVQGDIEFAPAGVERYNRLNQAQRLAEILDRLAAG